MKTFSTLILILSLFVLPVLNVAAQQTAPAQETMTNDEVVSLTKAGLDKTVIVGKIRSSRANFDLSTDALVKLKQAGVADEVVAAMLPSDSMVLVDAKWVDLNVPDGTEVEVQLKNNLSGEEVKIGDIVDLSVVRDVTVNGSVIIAAGSTATARITNAKKAGHWGRTGKLEWAMQEVQTVGGTRIPMRFTKSTEGGSNVGTVAVGAVVTAVFFGPVGLLWGLKKGKKAIIPAGSKFSVFSDKDSTVKVKAAGL